MNQNGPHSVSLWVQWDDYPKTGITKSIITKGSNNGGVQIGADPSNFTIRTLNNASTLGLDKNTILPRSDYFHLAYSFDAEKFVTYLDGVAIDENSNPNPAISSHSGGLRFGLVKRYGACR